MTSLKILCVLLLLATTAYAAKVTPGELRVVDACQQDIQAQPTDMIEIRIPNPALPMTVHDLDVDPTGAAVIAGVVHTTNGLPGGDRISIFVNLKSDFRSGTLEYSYKDGTNQQHTCKLNIQIIK